MSTAQTWDFRSFGLCRRSAPRRGLRGGAAAGAAASPINDGVSPGRRPAPLDSSRTASVGRVREHQGARRAGGAVGQFRRASLVSQYDRSRCVSFRRRHRLSRRRADRSFRLDAEISQGQRSIRLEHRICVGAEKFPARERIHRGRLRHGSRRLRAQARRFTSETADPTARYMPPTYDSQLPAPLGNIVLRNLRIVSNVAGGNAIEMRRAVSAASRSRMSGSKAAAG